MDNPFSTPSGAPPEAPFFKNRKVILTSVLVVLLLGYGVWAYYGFSLDFFRFFAADECDINPTLCEPTPTPTPTATATPQHFECVNQTCQLVPGPGNNTCNPANTNSCATQTTTPTPTGEPTPTPTGAPETISCIDGLQVVGAISIAGGGTSASVKNNSSQGCVVSLASYEIWQNRGGTPPHYISTQTLFDSQTVTVARNQTVSLSAGVPNCYTQVDLVVGQPLVPPNYNSGNLIAFRFTGPPYCDAAPTPTGSSNPGTPTPSTAVCPATPPSGATTTNVTRTSVVLNWTPGTGGSFQQLRVGPNQAEVNSGCQANPTTCVVVQNNLPSTTNSYTIPNNTLTPGTTYYWRVVNISQGPPVCYKDVAAQFTTLVTTPTTSPTATVTATPTLTATPTGGSALIQKFGRNITRGGTVELSSVTAYANDTIEFTIRVRALTAEIINATVSDTLPSYITYIPGSTTVDGASVADGITGNGINIGTIAVNQQRVIRFQGKVAGSTALPVGTTSVINVARLFTPSLIAQLPISIINSGDVTQVPTGAEESILTALLISLMITLMYVAYTRTQLFQKHEIKSMLDKKKEREDSFDFKNKK